MWVGDRLETEAEMFLRWESALNRLKAMAEYNGLIVSGWVYPGGDYGQLSIETDDTVRSAYRRAVEAHFAFAFAPTSRGTSVPHEDTWRVPVRMIYAGTSLETVSDDLVFQHPTRAGVKELAKILSWNGQLPRADRLFRRAEELGVVSEDLYYAHARNAYYEEDVPTTLELARKAYAIAPESERVQRLMEDAETRLRPLAGVVPMTRSDSDGRTYTEWRASYSDYISERTMLFGDVGYGHWKDDEGSVEGTFAHLGARYHTKPEHWIEGAIGYTFFDGKGASDFLGFRLAYHGTFSRDTLHINGTYDIEYSHEGLESRSAMAEGIHADRVEAAANFRVNNWWDISLSSYFVIRSDNNDTWGISFRPMYRWLDYPQLSVGYWGQIADSGRNPAEYWAPVNYQSHMLVVMLRH
jgi:hypothetical protein